MKNFRVAFFLTLLLGGGVIFCRAQEAVTKYQGKVVSVENGNTLTLSIDDKRLRVRLLGIDVSLQTLGEESRKTLAKLVDDKTVTFEAVPLRLAAGKQLIYVGQLFLGGSDVALAQLESGMAWQSDENEKYQTPQELKDYAEAEERAGKAGRGIWGKPYSDCGRAAPKTSVRPEKTDDAGEAKKAKVTGTVIVTVRIDKSGSVIAAKALCGHPILQNAALRAAYQSKFDKAASEIVGNIVYNFVSE